MNLSTRDGNISLTGATGLSRYQSFFQSNALSCFHKSRGSPLIDIESVVEISWMRHRTALPKIENNNRETMPPRLGASCSSLPLDFLNLDESVQDGNVMSLLTCDADELNIVDVFEDAEGEDIVEDTHYSLTLGESRRGSTLASSLTATSYRRSCCSSYSDRIYWQEDQLDEMLSDTEDESEPSPISLRAPSRTVLTQRVGRVAIIGLDPEDDHGEEDDMPPLDAIVFDGQNTLNTIMTSSFVLSFEDLSHEVLRPGSKRPSIDDSEGADRPEELPSLVPVDLRTVATTFTIVSDNACATRRKPTRTKSTKSSSSSSSSKKRAGAKRSKSLTSMRNQNATANTGNSSKKTLDESDDTQQVRNISNGNNGLQSRRIKSMSRSLPSLRSTQEKSGSRAIRRSKSGYMGTAKKKSKDNLLGDSVASFDWEAYRYAH